MSKILAYEKYNNISLSNSFNSNGKFTQVQSLKLGTEIDNNHVFSLTNAVFLVGGAFSQGQTIKSFYDLNDNGPYYNYPTNSDNLNIILSYSSIFNLYYNLSLYPYLFPLYNSSKQQEVIEKSKENPIFRHSGKGIGKVEFYSSGNSQTGDLSIKYNPEYMSFYYNSNIFDGKLNIAQPTTLKKPGYPYSGIMYSGNLVQMVIEKQNEYTNYADVKVIPYQSGRGIPQYDPSKKYFSGDSFSIPIWPNTTLKIKPALSMGTIPGNNDSCFGVALDTETNEKVSKMYNYKIPEGYTDEELNQTPYTSWKKWDTHSSPMTANSNNISFTKTPKIFSPENSNNNYYAPWPKYYAYNHNDAVPVLNRGVTSGKIGCAYNIGAQAYYEPDVEPGDDPINNPNYISVSCVPLFQGEKIKVGSQVYASTMGNIISEYPIGTSPYPIASYGDSSGLCQININNSPVFIDASIFALNPKRDARKENPWYDWYDVTLGAVGWTGTPQFNFSNIPDLGIAIIETKNNKKLPYLNQSNQGTIIVQGTTIRNTLNDGGSGRMKLIAEPEYTKPFYHGNTINQKFINLTKLPGTAERSLPIGHLMQEIEGTGEWTYKGTIKNSQQTTFINGINYQTQIYNTSGGTGINATVSIIQIDAKGSIINASLNSPGTDYTNNDILTTISSKNYADRTIQAYGNSASFIYDTINSTISINPHGSNYTSSTFVEGFNVSLNNMTVTVTSTNYNDTDVTCNALYGVVTSIEVESVTDYTKYPVGTTIGVFYDGLSKEDCAYAVVASNSGTVIELLLTNAGSVCAYPLGSYVYSTFIVEYVSPKFRIIADENTGKIDSIGVIDYGRLNADGDHVIIIQPNSSNNCIIELNKDINDLIIATPLIEGGGEYRYTPIENDIRASNYIENNYSFTNILNIYNPGNIFSNGKAEIGPVKEGGILQQVNIRRLYTDNSSNNYTAKFGDIQHLVQNIAPGVNTQPVVGTISPTNGWNTYVERRGATFYQEVDFKIINKGTGNQIGGPFNITGGSGVGMTLIILDVDDNGGITKLCVSDIGNNYEVNDEIVIQSGNNDNSIILKFPHYTELEKRFGTVFLDVAIPFLSYDLEIIDPGSGYTLGDYKIDQPNRGFSIPSDDILRVTKVDSSGGVLDVVPIIDLVGFVELNNNAILIGGDNNAVVKLGKPKHSKNIEFTSGGSNYTTANNVTTFNLTKNSLYTICGLETTGAGECQVINYSNSDEKPTDWNLKRYNVGDTLSFIQGNNESCTADILSINLFTNAISFSQLTSGTGYTSPPVGDYAFLQTRNLSDNPTTVDIITNANGQITNVTLNTIGDGVEPGDFLLIEQVGSDKNAVVQITGEKDVPAPFQNFINGRKATHTEWNEYKNVLKSAVNLLNENVVFDMQQNYPNFYCNNYYYYGDPDNKDPSVKTLPV